MALVDNALIIMPSLIFIFGYILLWHKKMFDGFWQRIAFMSFLIVTLIGIFFLCFSLFYPSLDKTSQDQLKPILDEIALVGFGIAIASMGYTSMDSLNNDRKQKQFQDEISKDLHKIKDKLGSC